MSYYGSMRPNGMSVAGSYGSDRGVNPNGYQNWNNGGAYGYNQNGQSSSVFHKGNDTAKNQTERDQACLVHCFFHELRLVKGNLFIGTVRSNLSFVSDEQRRLPGEEQNDQRFDAEHSRCRTETVLRRFDRGVLLHDRAHGHAPSPERQVRNIVNDRPLLVSAGQGELRGFLGSVDDFVGKIAMNKPV